MEVRSPFKTRFTDLVALQCLNLTDRTIKEFRARFEMKRMSSQNTSLSLIPNGSRLDNPSSQTSNLPCPSLPQPRHQGHHDCRRQPLFDEKIFRLPLNFKYLWPSASCSPLRCSRSSSPIYLETLRIDAKFTLCFMIQVHSRHLWGTSDDNMLIGFCRCVSLSSVCLHNVNLMHTYVVGKLSQKVTCSSHLLPNLFPKVTKLVTKALSLDLFCWSVCSRTPEAQLPPPTSNVWCFIR